MDILVVILVVVGIVLAVVSLFVTPRGHQLLAAGVIAIGAGVLLLAT